MSKNLQKGFAVLELVLVLVIVGVIGLVAWRLVTVSGTGTETTTNTVLPTPVSGVNSTKDLDTVSSQLDATEIEAGDHAAQLESESAF